MEDMKVVSSVEEVKAVSQEVVQSPPVVNEKLSDVDRLTLELAKSKRQTSLEMAKTALANNESSDIAYKYLVLQLYMKYSLTSADAISESGEILRGGAVQAQVQ